MALVKGTDTSGAEAGGSTIYTLTTAVTVPSGDDRFLMFMLAHEPQGGDPTGVTFNGDAMTLKTTLSATGFVERSWGLENADAGEHNIVVTFGSAPLYGWRWLACGFRNCGGFGNTTTNNIANSPHSRSITASEGSAMYCGGAGTYSPNKITLAGTEYTSGFDVNGTVYTKNWVGKIGSPGLSSGSRSGIVTTAAPSWQITNTILEIKEVEAVTSTRRIFVC